MLRYLPDQAWIYEFIGETTGVQTSLQMKGFLEEVKRRGGAQFTATVADISGAINCVPPEDPWFYKNEYNAMLMESVAVKRDEVLSGKVPAATYHVPGALLFLQALKTRGVKIYFASGTDEADVQAEAAALGFAGFADGIAGALPKSEACAKEAALKRLVEQAGVAPDELAVVGDGKVEIALGKALGARTLGVATNETDFSILNAAKKARLEKAGADMIVGDFRDLRLILDFLGLGANPSFAFDKIRTYDAHDRTNLVTIESMFRPGVDPVPEWTDDGFDELVSRVRKARAGGHEVTLSMGAHVIKCGLGPYLIALMQEG